MTFWHPEVKRGGLATDFSPRRGIPIHLPADTIRPEFALMLAHVGPIAVQIKIECWSNSPDRVYRPLPGR